MADTCTCPPASNIACSVLYQPVCQIIPNGDRVNQGIYDVAEDITYFTYGLFNICFTGASPVTELYIAVDEFIPLANILAVEQRLDDCPNYNNLSYDYENNTGFTPPVGTRYLRILVNGELNIGSSALYRISILGRAAFIDVPFGSNVLVRTTFVNGVFVNNLLLPGSSAALRVTVLKNCDVSVENNIASINYTVIIGNPNSTAVTNVTYEDVINYNGTDVVIGTVTVVPSTISVDTTVTGRILLRGNFNTIPPGQTVVIRYTVTIDLFREAGNYTFSNMASVNSSFGGGFAQCNATIGAVGLMTTNCCNVSTANDSTYRLVVTNNARSPATRIVVRDLMTIPEGVVITFTSFDVCSAIFVDDSQPVPLNVPITNRQIIFTCFGDIPEDSEITYNIQFMINLTRNFTSNPVSLVNILEDVRLEQEEQVLIAVIPLPNNNSIDVKGLIQCNI